MLPINFANLAHQLARPNQLIRRLPTPIDVVKRPAYYAAAPVRHTPEVLQRLVLQKALNEVLKEAIKEGDFDALIDRKVKITITDAQFSWCLGLDQNRKLIITHSPDADTEIRGNSSALIKILSREIDPDTLFFQRQLLILGDTELGHEVKNLLDAIDPAQMPKAVRVLQDQVLPKVIQFQNWARKSVNSVSDALNHQEPLMTTSPAKHP